MSGLRYHPLPKAFRVNSPFGTPPGAEKTVDEDGNLVDLRTKPHRGTDYNTPVGTPLFASDDGVVVRTGYDSANGWHIMIAYDSGWRFAYVHLEEVAFDLVKGDRVVAGDVVGTTGNTGRSTGPHLHLEVRDNRNTGPWGVGPLVDPEGVVRGLPFFGGSVDVDVGAALPVAAGDGDGGAAGLLVGTMFLGGWLWKRRR